MSALYRVPRRASGSHPITLVAGCAALAAFFVLWNLRRSPDTQYDEVVYSRADQAVAQGWHLTWTNQPLFVHPPLSFLIQAAWLRVSGAADHPLIEVITSTRTLAGLVSVVNVVLLAMLAYRLMPYAHARRRAMLTLLTAVLASTDPVLLRFGRMGMIEAFALVGCLITLHLAIGLQARRAAVYVPVVGMATGLTLLTNEVGVFMLLTPLVYAVIVRNRSLLWRAAAALGAGLALWLVFSLWAVQLGMFSSFLDVKSITLQRLLGLVQTTGWNRPGVSVLTGISTALDQYVTSYIFLACGALALAWLFVRPGGHSYNWLLAWLFTSYAFGAYTVLLGTFNEQFFVYVVPAAIVATVLVAEAVFSRTRWPAVAAVTAAAAILALSTASWGRYYITRNDGMARLTSYVAAHLPTCAVLNATGDVDRFELLMSPRPIADYATGPGAMSHGVNLFVLSDKDAALRFGNASPALTAWVRVHGVRLASYPSATYRGLELWHVPSDSYDPDVGIERFPGGDFVFTQESRCAGFPVVDSTRGMFALGWAQIGGKATAGPPLTSSWDTGSRGYQVFAGAVLTSIPDGSGGTTVTAEPIVKRLASTDPAAYREANLPPITPRVGNAATVPGATAMLTDPPIRAAYRGAFARMLGQPLGPPTQMPDGRVRQAFEAGVVQRAVDSTDVRLASLGDLVMNARLVVPPPSARATVTAPTLPVEKTSPSQPTTVEPFVWSLAFALMLYAVVAVAFFVRRQDEDLIGAVAGDYPRLSQHDATSGVHALHLARRLRPASAAGRVKVQHPPSQPAAPRGKASWSAGAHRATMTGLRAPLGRRSALARIGILALLLTLAVTMRTSGFLQDPPSALPSLPHTEAVLPGVARGGQPKEADLVPLHDDYGVHTLVAVSGRDDSTMSSNEERVAAQSLGMRYLEISVPDRGVPSVAELSALVDLLHETGPSAETSPSVVMLHDRTGLGPVVMVSAMLQVLDGESLVSVRDRLPPAFNGLAPAQTAALQQLSDAVSGIGTNNPYASLRGSEW